MKIDEAAFEAGVRATGLLGHIGAERQMREFIRAYLAALPAEPEIEGVRVRMLAAVDADGFAVWHGTNQLDDETARHLASSPHRALERPFSIQVVQATLKPYTPPAEPVVEGRVVET